MKVVHHKMQFNVNCIFLNVILLLFRYSWATIIELNTKDFQLKFLKELETLAEHRTEESLNAYLRQLDASGKYAKHNADIAAALASEKLKTKVLLIKQLLDEEHTPAEQQYQQQQPKRSIQEDLADTFVLRNLIFLRKIRREMHQLQEASALEIRHLRIHRLCKQFRDSETTDATAVVKQLKSRSSATITNLINEQNVGAALHKLNATADATTNAFNLTKFGLDLYDKVKADGAEIIDNYLQILRELLQEVIDEKPENGAHSTRLKKVLSEIDRMLAIEDFYEKRQLLYAYLEGKLAADYEQFRNTEVAQQDLAEIFTKLKAKGLDLFVLFLFSNFEFLEHVHQEWIKLLPHSSSILNDAQARQLYDIQQHYDDFKQDTESTTRYDAYVAKLQQLHESIKQLPDAELLKQVHIFELLKNAAQNVGSVTFNMIKAKCNEI